MLVGPWILIEEHTTKLSGENDKKINVNKNLWDLIYFSKKILGVFLV
jgi:hypothetical protein